MKFAQYVDAAPIKYKKVVVYNSNLNLSNYMCFPDCCVSFAFRRILDLLQISLIYVHIEVIGHKFDVTRLCKVKMNMI